MCSNLGRDKLSFLFAKIIFGMDEKGQRNGKISEIERSLLESEQQTVLEF